MEDWQYFMDNTGGVFRTQSNIYLHFLAVNYFRTKHYPVDTRRKLNVQKTLRKRPGRRLKVLRTFNLRPVSTDYFVDV